MSEIQTQISGHTKLFGLIGNPVSHSFSPYIHNTLGKMLGHNIVYTTFRVLPEKLKDAICGAHALNVQGMNVTIPHKTDVLKYVTFVDELADSVGAANTLKLTENGYSAYNTDVNGISASFKHNGTSVKNKNVLIIGAGGSARAACASVIADGAKSVVIANRSFDKAQSIANDFSSFANKYGCVIETLSFDELNHGCSAVFSANLVIQNTSCGFGEQAGVSPVSDVSVFKNAEILLDVIYSPWKTKFIEDAEMNGIKAVNGFDMLVFQAIKSYEIWNELTVPDDIVSELRNKLENYLVSSKK